MTPVTAFDARLIARPRSDRPYDAALSAILDPAGYEAARKEIAAWPGYQPTPLVTLPGLAREAGFGAIWYKDEAGRFGLGSFKALGGAYAVRRLVEEKGSDITVCTATDGNHGRSVAWGARTCGCRAVIYIHATVSEGRKEAMEAFGAEVRRIAGNYDDSVRQADADASANGWFVVSDTSYEGYREIPRDVMHGYAVMAEEAIAQLPAAPTHVFVQGGVGGLAAAILVPFWWRHGPTRPRFVVVEPETAACLYASAEAGRPAVVPGDLDTVMAGLAAGEVSQLAWEILEAGADGFMTVNDESARFLMRRLAEGQDGDPPIVAGESAVAGLAGALAARQDPAMRDDLGLGSDSKLLVFGTEGATDPALYEAIVGRPAEAVASA